MGDHLEEKRNDQSFLLCRKFHINNIRYSLDAVISFYNHGHQAMY